MQSMPATPPADEATLFSIGFRWHLPRPGPWMRAQEVPEQASGPPCSLPPFGPTPAAADPTPRARHPKQQAKRPRNKDRQTVSRGERYGGCGCVLVGVGGGPRSLLHPTRLSSSMDPSSTPPHRQHGQNSTRVCTAGLVRWDTETFEVRAVLRRAGGEGKGEGQRVNFMATQAVKSAAPGTHTDRARSGSDPFTLHIHSIGVNEWKCPSRDPRECPQSPQVQFAGSTNGYELQAVLSKRGCVCQLEL